MTEPIETYSDLSFDTERFASTERILLKLRPQLIREPAEVCQ
jgi:hypothetical protein